MISVTFTPEGASEMAAAQQAQARIAADAPRASRWLSVAAWTVFFLIALAVFQLMEGAQPPWWFIAFILLGAVGGAGGVFLYLRRLLAGMVARMDAAAARLGPTTFTLTATEATFTNAGTAFVLRPAGVDDIDELGDMLAFIAGSVVYCVPLAALEEAGVLEEARALVVAWPRP